MFNWNSLKAVGKTVGAGLATAAGTAALQYLTGPEVSSTLTGVIGPVGTGLIGSLLYGLKSPFRR